MLGPLLLPLLLSSLAYSHGVGDDLAQQVRGHAESLKEALRKLSNNPKANRVLRRIRIHTDMCFNFNTLDDVIETVETGTQLVENVAGEIEEILEIAKGFVTGTSESLENTMELMRAIDILVPSLVLETEACSVTNVDEYEYIYSLSLIIAELSWTDGLLDKQYQKTGDVLAKVANFLYEYSNPHYPHCTGHQNIPIVKVVGPVIVDLAKLYRLLWGDTAADEMTGDQFEQKIVDNMENIPGFNSTSLDCATLRSVASKTLGNLTPGTTTEEMICRVIFIGLSISTVIIAAVHAIMKVKRKRGRRGYEVI